ncbi:uncharacterized protein PHALS_06950 [Plasmopara halstedii]|uniref:Uncharacterized protein n=1 Tax=Plasmopara halstedii TaxID=4781 RepID=A0A0P1B4V8_PLAHL|nr:uncharacterized protein PHALS_06950 [Plasmopara halstedii]CEG49172.1 hypothetical protein PHALS_06950 [Plasmopara halstedii]|eukprot:XP_024585541.1 hypothetical protein PHALS_06950 [Plasmopara halstedii]
MYATHIHTPQVDPLERGPPKRVLREEQHIGERVAASKKRVAWRFTLGESDRTHEVALIHSVMSYKKVVLYDGRQMHFSSTATLGDWNFTMILDGLNMIMEVRINDVESAEVPKYDFAIDRVPYRRWDVYRRKKHAITTATYAQPNAPPGNTYGMHRWGPSGALPPSQNESNRELYSGGSCGSVTDSSQKTSRTHSFGRQSAQSQSSWGNRSSERTRSFPEHQNGQQSSADFHQQSSLIQEQTRATNSHGKSIPPLKAPTAVTQSKINLLDDFDSSVSLSAQALIFDPLVSVPSKENLTTRGLPSAQQQQVPPVAANVDPFASVAAPISTKPAEMINLDPFTTQHAVNSHVQHRHQERFYQIPAGFMHQSTVKQPLSMPVVTQVTIQQMQHQGKRDFMTVQQSHDASGRMNNVNYSISQLMNPENLQAGQQHQHSKSNSINIDAFASLGQ